VEHYGNINVTAGNFSIGRGSQGSGAGTTIWNLHEGNFSMANATTQNSNPTPGNAKFVFTKDGGVQNLLLSNVTYAGGGLPIQVDSAATLNMDTTAVGGNGAFILSPGATLQTAHPGGLNAAIATTGVVTLSEAANFTFNGTQAQAVGALLPDTLGVLTLSNPAGVAFNDTVRSAKLVVSPGTLMRIDSLGSVTADSGSVGGTVINKGELVAVAPLDFTNGSVYEHARDGGSVPSGVWNEGSTALFTGVTTTAPENRGQDYYHLTLNTPGMVSNRDLALDGNTIHGNLTVINTGLSRWQLVGGSSGTVTIRGDVIMESGQLATQGTSSATNVVVEHYGDVNVSGGNFSIGRGSQGSGTGTTIWNLHEGNFSMANATTQNSNPTPGNAKFVFTKDGGTQNLTLSNVTYGGGGLPIQVDSSATLNMDTTAVGGNGTFILSQNATLATAHAGGIAGAVQSTGALTFNEAASYILNGTVAQVTSTLMPDTVNGLAINNEAGVVLSQATVINGVLRLMAGEFDNTIPFKLGTNGSISYEGGRLKVPVSVEERESELPKEFALFQNYPNPFNP
ncbi:T9SS C-terminal target domain-containing protein, partial [candidate division KSB1 bacterium]|nr:T9SS C-terminal target domain-containing protein [candidate division KSB1 bacterium]